MVVTDKVVLITGGGSGMGAETARYLAQQGAKIALLDRDLAAAEAVVQETGGVAFGCDVTSAAEVEAAVQKVAAHYHSIHVLINCAGIAPGARMVGREGAMPLDAFAQVIQVNLIGTFNVMRVVAAQMMTQEVLNDDQERGVIINTASVAAYDGQIGQAAYSASKGGVVSMMLPVAREMAKFGIRIMTIAPGVIATPLMAGMTDKVQQNLLSSVPFPKRFGRADEFASLAQHIIENRYLNAEVIRMDAAMRMSI